MKVFCIRSCATVHTILILGVLLAVGAPAEESADPLLAEMGRESFQRLCTSCHGVTGRGNGPVASSLKIRPADLTRIAARRGGDFPRGEIARKIDGRFEIPAHGSREMPIWGQMLSRDVPNSSLAEELSRGKIATLVEYLKSIQLEHLDGDRDAQWRQTMDEIFAAMSIVLPLSLDEKRFEDPEHRKLILSELSKLSEKGARLESHATQRDAGFAYLSGSLARDARDLKRRYENGRFSEARFLLHQMTSNCVACHSRLPSERSFSLGERFVEGTAVAALPLDERARYEMATRQFERALATHEELFAERDTDPSDIDLLGHIDDYLEISIRVERDYERPLRTLERLATRDDLSPSLRGDLTRWIASLRALEGRKAERNALEEGKALFAIAQDARRFSDEREALVYYIAASGALNRHLAAQTHPGPDRAETYYLLGVIESRIGLTLWLSQSEAYLEAAIRLAPDASFAPDAYELYRDVVLSGWTGSGGVRTPPDVDARLEQLRRMVENDRPASRTP